MNSLNTYNIIRVGRKKSGDSLAGSNLFRIFAVPQNCLRSQKVHTSSFGRISVALLLCVVVVLWQELGGTSSFLHTLNYLCSTMPQNNTGRPAGNNSTRSAQLSIRPDDFFSGISFPPTLPGSLDAGIRPPLLFPLESLKFNRYE